MEILEPVLWRVLAVYGLGLILIWGLNGASFKNLWSRNLGQRYLSWLIMGPLYVAAVALGSLTSLLLLALVMSLAVWEFGRLAQLPRANQAGLWILLLFSLVIALWVPVYFYLLPVLYFVVFNVLALYHNHAQESLVRSSLSFWGAMWIIFGLLHFVALTELRLDTIAILFLIGFALPLSDVMAYVVGNFFKRIPQFDQLKIADQLSPKKSFPGVLGNILGALMGVGIMWFALEPIANLWFWASIGVAIGIAGVIGDITASMVKRSAKAKDSSQLIPGHGGVLDRVDSTLMAVLIIFYACALFL